MRLTLLYVYWASKPVIPAKAGIQKSENAGFPPYQVRGRLLKRGMTVKLKRLMTQYTSDAAI